MTNEPRRIFTTDQLLELLDEVIADGKHGDRTNRHAGEFWSKRLTRADHPLAHNLPDEPLVDWYRRGLLGDFGMARALDVGCGNARNSRWMGQLGAEVVGVDIASSLLAKVRPTLPPKVELLTLDILRDPLPEGPFDIIYDSGCFHHLPPHRRITYLDRVIPLLAPAGRYAVVAFSSEAIDTRGDEYIYATGDSLGGMTFSISQLRAIFDSHLTPLEIRRVASGIEGSFSPPYLNAALFARRLQE